MLPGDYRGSNSNKVAAYRLKNGASNAGLPSFTDILKDPFIAGKPARSATRAASVMSPSMKAIFRTATPNANAADIASRALANMPGVRITRPSAAEFLRMSPRSRTALLTRPRNRNASRSVVVRNVTRTRGANIVRETTRRVPAANIRRLPLGTGSRVTRTGPIMTIAELRAIHEHPSRPNSSRRGTPPAAAAAPAARRTTPARRREALPPITVRERAGIARGMRNVRRAAVTESRGRAGRRLTPKQILNKYTNNMNNLRTLTRRVLKAKLTNSGFAAANANRHARNWEANWLASRASTNHAVRNLKKGKNITKRGYANNVLPVAHRRHAENLSKGTNGRVRKGGVLLSGKTKPQLVAMAQRHGITGSNSMTKDMIIAALYG
jgi:hypothetical protein